MGTLKEHIGFTKLWSMNGTAGRSTYTDPYYGETYTLSNGTTDNTLVGNTGLTYILYSLDVELSTETISSYNYNEYEVSNDVTDNFSVAKVSDATRQDSLYSVHDGVTYTISVSNRTNNVAEYELNSIKLFTKPTSLATKKLLLFTYYLDKPLIISPGKTAVVVFRIVFDTPQATSTPGEGHGYLVSVNRDFYKNTNAYLSTYYEYETNLTDREVYASSIYTVANRRRSFSPVDVSMKDVYAETRVPTPEDIESNYPSSRNYKMTIVSETRDSDQKGVTQVLSFENTGGSELVFYTLAYSQDTSTSSALATQGVFTTMRYVLSDPLHIASGETKTITLHWQYV